MKKRSLNIFDAGIAFVMAFVVAQLTGSVCISITQTIIKACGISATTINNFWDTAWGYLVKALYMNIGFVIVFIWYITHRSKQPMLTKPNRATFKYFGACILIGIATLFLLSGTLNYFQLMLNKLNYVPATIPYQINSVGKYIISLISLAIIPAICEELIFRGILTNALKQKGEIFAIVLSSVMFAIFHFSPSQLIYPICFGLILSIVYLRTGNIIFPILLHFINNALSISIQYFSSDTTAVFTHSMSVLIYTIITLLIWIYIIYRLFKDFKQHKLSAINETSDANSDLNTSSQTENNNTHNTQILYISIAIMLVLYILLLFV